MSDKQVSNPWLEAVAKLTELTQARTLLWEAQGATDENTTGSAYYAKYKGKTLRLRKVRQRSIEGVLMPRVFGAPPITLEFVDDADNSLWVFPETQAVRDLYSAVQYQAAGVHDFLNELLNEG